MTAPRNNASNQPLALETRLEQWQVQQVLGRTRSGFFYLADNSETGHCDFLYEYFPDWKLRRQRGLTPQVRVKDKASFQQGLERFLLQAHSWSQVQDLHLQPVIHYGEHHGTAILVTTCCAGRTLNDFILNESEVLDEQQLQRLLQAGLRALHALSQAALIHSDLSPQTLFLPELAAPYVLGFGVPGISTGCQPLSCYQPIEVEQNIYPSSPQTDLYGLGASLYHALTGQPPIMAETRLQAITRGQDDPLIPAVEIGHGRYNHALTGAIDWMLSPLLRDRPMLPETLLGQIIRPTPTFHLQEPGANTQAQKQDPKTSVSTPPNKSKKSGDHKITSTPEIHLTSPSKIPAIIPNQAATGRTGKKRHSFSTGWVLITIISVLIAVTYFLYQLDSTISDPPSITGKTKPSDATDLPPALPKELPVRNTDQQRITAYRKINIEDKIRKQIEQQLQTQAAAAELEQEQLLAQEKQQRQQQLIQLWEQISIAKKQAHYLWPRKGSVQQLLATIQMLQPDDVKVREMQQNLACWFLAEAEFYRLADEPHQAYLSLLQASAFDANESMLQSALNKQQRRIETPAPPIVDPALEAKRLRLKRLLSKARFAFSRGNWFTPPGNNALGLFRAAQNMDSKNIPARDGLQRLDQQLKRRLFRAIREQDKVIATKWLTGLQTLNPDDPELITLASQVNRIQSAPKPVASANANKSIRQRTADKAKPSRPTPVKTIQALTKVKPTATTRSIPKKSLPQPEPKITALSAQLQQAITAYQNQDYTKAYKLLQPLVKKRVTRAVFRSGMMLIGGKGVERDRPEALNRLELALPAITQRALQGESWAQVALGLYFDNGWLMQSNAGSAVALYRRAATSGNADAMNNLGLMYASGRGVTENLTTAKSWLLQAKHKGHKIAATNLDKLDRRAQNRIKRQQQDPLDLPGN